MYQQNKKKMVLGLVIVAVILLLFGIYMLLTLFFSDTFSDIGSLKLPGKGTSLSVNGRDKPVVLEAKTVIKTSTSTIDQEMILEKQKLQDVVNVASDVVARIGSGSNQDGFRGYNDVLLSVDQGYRDILLKKQEDVIKKYPLEKGFMEMITRVLVKNVLIGSIGDNVIKIKLQGQYTEDDGEINNPYLVQYKEYVVIMKKQSNDKYFVSQIQESVFKR